MFRWNATKVNSTVSTNCFYGPPEVKIERFCTLNATLTIPSLEMCKTVLSTRFTDLENVSYIQAKGLEMLNISSLIAIIVLLDFLQESITLDTFRKLTVLVNSTMGLSDQNSDNVRVVSKIFVQTAELLLSPNVMLSEMSVIEVSKTLRALTSTVHIKIMNR